eukprot:90555-Prymnesium_polylepis.1
MRVQLCVPRARAAAAAHVACDGGGRHALIWHLAGEHLPEHDGEAPLVARRVVLEPGTRRREAGTALTGCVVQEARRGAHT